MGRSYLNLPSPTGLGWVQCQLRDGDNDGKYDQIYISKDIEDFDPSADGVYQSILEEIESLELGEEECGVTLDIRENHDEGGYYPVLRLGGWRPMSPAEIEMYEQQTQKEAQDNEERKLRQEQQMLDSVQLTHPEWLLPEYRKGGAKDKLLNKKEGLKVHKMRTPTRGVTLTEAEITGVAGFTNAYANNDDF